MSKSAFGDASMGGYAEWETACEKRIKELLEEEMSEPERLEIPTPWGKRKMWCFCNAHTMKGSSVMLTELKVYERQGCLFDNRCCGSAWVYRDKDDEPTGG